MCGTRGVGISWFGLVYQLYFTFVLSLTSSLDFLFGLRSNGVWRQIFLIELFWFGLSSVSHIAGVMFTFDSQPSCISGSFCAVKGYGITEGGVWLSST